MKLIQLKMNKSKQITFVKKFFINLLLENQDIIYNKDVPECWKNRIFVILSACLIIFCLPLFFYGAYMFYKDGYAGFAIAEISAYFIMAAVIMQKHISISTRKFFIILTLYCISIGLLILTGVMGAGLVCVLAVLILAGCLLNGKQASGVVVINIGVFMVLTIMLKYGYFDGTSMKAFKNVWLINVMSTQISGIILLHIINAVYNGFENQTQLLKKSKESLTASEAKHKAMIANISDIIVILDENGIIRYISPNIEQKCGFAREIILDSILWERIHPEELEYVKEELMNLLGKSGLKKTIETRIICVNGDIEHVELTAVNLINDINIKGILINFHDITERKMREEKILHLNYHDSLTGLYNRAFFEKEKERLDNESQLPLSLILGDINGLKFINDSLGHGEGDKLLAGIAKILEGCCSKEGIIARTGGDEFKILLPRTDNEAACEIARKINSACEDYNKRMSSELYYTSISLGYATRVSMDESLNSISKTAEDHMYNRKLLEGRSIHSSIISSMKTALFEKSEETEEHANRLIKLSKAVGQVIGLTDQQFDELELLSALHDIGKIGIDDQILNKPGKLTDAEWVEMKKHPEVGYRIAMSSPELIPIAEYILTHHERWDGDGYPQRLAGEDIPLLSRILAVVDAYDAMTEDRSYRKGMPKREAIDELIRNSGSQFDQRIVKIFVEIQSKED